VSVARYKQGKCRARITTLHSCAVKGRYLVVLRKWKHITLTSWPDGQRVYDALEHDYISDIRKKEIAGRRRKKEKKKERES
jgi:hypothetical protein